MGKGTPCHTCSGGPDKFREAMECVEKTSNAIDMRFGVRKCGTGHRQKRKVLTVPDNPEHSEKSIRGLEKVLVIST